MEPVSAFEVKYLTFNVWGEHVSTLQAVEIMDMKPGAQALRAQKWNVFSENEAEEFHASLGFISRVRMASGVVRNADNEFVIREAQRFSEKFTAEDLEPKPPRKV
jgi:hypothetical protein